MGDMCLKNRVQVSSICVWTFSVVSLLSQCGKVENTFSAGVMEKINQHFTFLIAPLILFSYFVGPPTFSGLPFFLACFLSCLLAYKSNHSALNFYPGLFSSTSIIIAEYN